MALKIQDETNTVCGVVLENNENRYSSTNVEGEVSTSSHGYTSGNISTTVSHHKIQKIWLKLSDDQERVFRFDDVEIDVRVGHEVAIICNKNNDTSERLVNKSIGRYWTVGPSYPKGRRMVFSLIGASLISLPYLSLIFCMTRWFDRVVSIEPKGFRFFRKVFSFCAVLLAILLTAFFSRSVRDAIPEVNIPIPSGFQAAASIPLEYVVYGYLYFNDRALLAEVREKRRTSMELTWYAEMNRIERAKYDFGIRDFSWEVSGWGKNGCKNMAIFMFLICVWVSSLVCIRNNKILSQYRQLLDEHCSKV